MNRCAKNGGAPRRRFPAICEKPEGGGVQTPPGPARVKLANKSFTLLNFTKDFLKVSPYLPLPVHCSLVLNRTIAVLSGLRFLGVQINAPFHKCFVEFLCGPLVR